MSALARFLDECDDYDDAERFRWWFSSEPKANFLPTYLQGIREGWNLDQWRAAIDQAREPAASPGNHPS